MDKPIIQTASLRSILFLMLWVGLLLIIRGPEQSVMAHDEGWYAQQARWIVENGDWITQQWWGELIYDRAMGLQWLIAISYHLFGINETAARLPGVVAALGAVLLTYAIGRRCLPEKMALVGAMILGATPIWMQSARLATQDVMLTAIELMAIWALLRAEESNRAKWCWGVLAGTSLGLGFMVKSFMVFPAAAALLPYLIFNHRRHRHLANPGIYGGFFLGSIPPLLWMGLSIQRYGWVPVEKFFGHIFSLSQTAFHAVGPFYYFWNIPVNAFPWPLLAIPGAILAVKSHRYRRQWLWLGYPICLFVELTLFKTRTWYYPLQLLPFVALMAAVTLVSLARLYNRRQRSVLTIGFTVGLAVLGLGMFGVGLALILRPGLFGLEPSWAYGLIGLAAGIGWLVPISIYGYDRLQRHRSPEVWLLGCVLGPWLAVAVLYGTGLWGNYSDHTKQPLQSPPLVDILQANPINFVFPEWNYNGSGKDTVLLTFYTPQLGERLSTVAEVPDGEYAWVHAEMLPTIVRPHETIGNAGNWSLVYYFPN